MSMQAFLIRFFLIYAGLSAAASIAMILLGVEGHSAVSTGVLIGSVMWVSHWFARRNKRYFTSVEKRNTVLGIVLIDLALQTVGAAVALSGEPAGLSVGSLLFGVLIVGAFRGVAVWFFVGFLGKQFATQVASGSC